MLTFWAARALASCHLQYCKLCCVSCDNLQKHNVILHEVSLNCGVTLSLSRGVK